MAEVYDLELRYFLQKTKTYGACILEERSIKLVWWMIWAMNKNKTSTSEILSLGILTVDCHVDYVSPFHICQTNVAWDANKVRIMHANKLINNNKAKAIPVEVHFLIFFGLGSIITLISTFAAQLGNNNFNSRDGDVLDNIMELAMCHLLWAIDSKLTEEKMVTRLIERSLMVTRLIERSLKGHNL
ncbi:hypothetical protein ACJX0J_005799, partial [Zea mays]